MKIPKHSIRGFTLIEMLICIAILSLAFTGLFTVTVTSYKEGRFGAEDMMARQQTHLAGRAIFRDVKNAAAAPARLGEFAAGEECLVLEMSGATGAQPAAIVYYTSGGRLMRRVEMADGNMNTVALVENLKRAEFARDGAMITWCLEAEVSYQEHARRNESHGAARLGGAER